MAIDNVAMVRREIRRLADPKKAKTLQWFFKTGPGDYGEGDVFVGVKVPELRRLAKKHDLSVSETRQLLKSKIHEERLLALLILVRVYLQSDAVAKKKIYEIYLRNTRYINNWDLVDGSAHFIVGDYLMTRSRSPLYRLAKSSDLWERRIAILSTYHFIKRNDYDDTLKVARMLLEDEQDLIHKAVGWMLREVGNRDRPTEERFLKELYKRMPRTMLRYAIEKFPETKRQQYLKGKI